MFIHIKKSHTGKLEALFFVNMKFEQIFIIIDGGIIQENVLQSTGLGPEKSVVRVIVNTKSVPVQKTKGK